MTAVYRATLPFYLILLAGVLRSLRSMAYHGAGCAIAVSYDA
jgi:hypothetical protein